MDEVNADDRCRCDVYAGRSGYRVKKTINDDAQYPWNLCFEYMKEERTDEHRDNLSDSGSDVCDR